MVDEILSAALRRELLDASRPWAVFFDRERLNRRFERLQAAFPEGSLHAVAIKANPLGAVLRELVDAGAGLEAASFGEVKLAMAAGLEGPNIVFDSPAKTAREIEASLNADLYLNADNFAELARIADCEPGPTARVGLRVNPLVGAGSIDVTSVSRADSKFGVPLSGKEDELVEAFRRHPWLRGLHVHTGSQGYGVDLLVEGARRCVDLALRIERELGAGRIDTVDIGGGLPVAYRPDDVAPTVEDYADALRAQVPELFNDRWRLITEFGRWLHGPCAFAASRVEYVKESAAGPIAVVHFGADLMLRPAYRPDDWYHHISVHDARGATLETEDAEQLTVAGPLCFAGDVIARRRPLPRPAPGDILVAHDVGAYTFSMWSRYCSRSFPRIYGYDSSGPDTEFQVLHPGEDADELVDFWSP